MTMPVSSVPSLPTSSFEHDSFKIGAAWLARYGAGSAFDAIYQERKGYTPPNNTSVSYQKIADNIKSGKGPGVSVSGYFKNTVYQGNLQPFKEFSQRPGMGAASGIGIALSGLHVLNQTSDGYQAAKAKYGDNTLAVTASTAGTATVSVVKAALVWEFSRAVCQLLSHVGVAGKVPVLGIATATVAAVAATKALDAVIPPPQNTNKAGRNSDEVFQSVRQSIQPGNPYGLGQSSQAVYG